MSTIKRFEWFGLRTLENLSIWRNSQKKRQKYPHIISM